jgi:hypothetical protein
MRLFAALAFLSLLTIAFPAPAHEVDPTRLPLGDGHISSEPKKGWIWACRVDKDAGGAWRDGPWIKPDGTFDFTKKAVVPGDVAWPSHYEIALAGETRRFTSNDFPQHGTGIFPIPPDSEAFRYDRNPNHLAEQNISIELPAHPTPTAKPACVPGAVGFLVTGAVLFNALDAPGRDAVAHETQDRCQGHPQISGVYHYHSVTSCLPDKREADGSSALVGYALDGFGIYGRFGEGGKELSTDDLDECHGRVSTVMWDGKAVAIYHYVATLDFPYTIGCMRGAYRLDDVRKIAGPPPSGFGPPPPPRN